jgi:hypothetical protein
MALLLFVGWSRIGAQVAVPGEMAAAEAALSSDPALCYALVGSVMPSHAASLSDDDLLGVCRFSRLLRAAFDQIAGIILLVLMAPLLLVLATLVGADGGPAFYRHRRIGDGGRVFGCVNFRSMAVDAEGTPPAAGHRSCHPRPR